MRLLIDFLCRFGWGLSLALAVTPAALVPSGFFRVNLLVVLGLATFAALLERTAVPGAMWMLPAAAAAVAWLGSVAWLAERKAAGIAACGVCAVLMAAARSPRSRGRRRFRSSPASSWGSPSTPCCSVTGI